MTWDLSEWQDDGEDDMPDEDMERYVHEYEQYISELYSWGTPNPPTGQGSKGPTPDEAQRLKDSDPPCSSCSEEEHSVGYGYRGSEVYPLGEKCFKERSRDKWFDGARTW